MLFVLLCVSLSLIYLFLVHPCVWKRVDMSAFEQVYIAHRGYFDKVTFQNV